MVEVTKHNFDECLDKISYDLKKCSYYSLDCEFSGLPSFHYDSNIFDGSAERYAKIRENVKGCVILQIGLSTFSFNRDLNRYDASLYKFHIFPQNFGPVDPTVNFKASTVQFFNSTNFNFEKSFVTGIPYFNKSHIEKLNQAYEEKGPFFIDYSLFNRQLRDTIEEVTLWENSSNVRDTMEMSLKNSNINFIYALHEEIRSISNLWTYFVKDTILIENVGKEKKEKLESDENLINEVIKSLRGFSEVYEIMIDSKKPIVGHNMLFDLLVMYHQFYKNLPNTFKEFRADFHKLFPNVYDTKFMCFEIGRMSKKTGHNSIPLTDLGYLYDMYKDKNDFASGPEVYFKSGIYDEEQNQCVHDAGWDSYITGYCFIKLCHTVAISNLQKNHLRMITTSEHLKMVEFLRNRINIARAKIPFLNLEGPDPESLRPPLLHVELTNSSKGNFKKLDSILCKYSNIHMKSISKFSVLLAASNYTSYRNILKEVNGYKDFRIEKYSPIRHSKLFKPLIFAGVIIPAALTLWISFVKFR